MFGLGLLLGGIIGCTVGMVTIVKRANETIDELYEALVEWTELADNIHLPGRELYERSIRALNRAKGW